MATVSEVCGHVKRYRAKFRKLWDCPQTYTQGLYSNEGTACDISSYQQLPKDEWRPETLCCGLKGSILLSEWLQWKSYKEHSVQTNGEDSGKAWVLEW